MLAGFNYDVLILLQTGDYYLDHPVRPIRLTKTPAFRKKVELAKARNIRLFDITITFSRVYFSIISFLSRITLQVHLYRPNTVADLEGD